MKNQALKHSSHSKTLIRCCHVCGHLNESKVELERCQKCKKAFLPSHYFQKIHKQESTQKPKYSKVEELEHEKKLLIKGISVIW